MAQMVYDAFLGAGNNLRQITNVAYNPGAEIVRARQSGAVDPSEHYLRGADPRAQLTTMDLSGLLSFASVIAGTGLLSGDTILLPFQKEDNGGTFLGTLSHDVLTATEGFVYPTQISAAQDDDGATAQCEVVFLSTDGFVDPVTLNANQTLTASAFNAQFGFGPAYFGGSLVPECVGWTVDCGIQISVKRYQGAVYPTRVYLTQRNPTIQLVFESFSDAAAFITAAAAMVSAAVYARRFVDGQSYDADANPTHIKLAFATGIANLDSLSVGANAQGQATVMLNGEGLTQSTASMIP